MGTMKAVVLRQPGPPDVLKIEQRPIPVPQCGEVLIRVKAFGVNRSELFTRQGLSPQRPPPLGIEAVGLVAQAPGNEFHEGETVATAMGGMGRDYDGGYSEYTCVPATQIQALKTTLSWETLGALPEMMQTSWRSLFKSLRLEKGERLLIRGGTTSIGLTAAALAKLHGAVVAAWKLHFSIYATSHGEQRWLRMFDRIRNTRVPLAGRGSLTRRISCAFLHRDPRLELLPMHWLTGGTPAGRIPFYRTISVRYRACRMAGLLAAFSRIDRPKLGREAPDTPPDTGHSAQSMRRRKRCSRASNVIPRISDCRCFD
jgi:hypothetical protein